MTSNIYTNIEAHILRSNMNSIHERHVSSQEKPRRMNHTFLKITRWRNNRQPKKNSRLCHHIALVTSFPTSQEFCNFDSVWESYLNFSEDTHKVFPPQSFTLFSKSCEIPEKTDDQQKKCLIFYLYSFWRKSITLDWHAIKNYK